MAPEKNRPYTVWTATLRSICWNFPVNLKQCILVLYTIRTYTVYTKCESECTVYPVVLLLQSTLGLVPTYANMTGTLHQNMYTENTKI